MAFSVTFRVTFRSSYIVLSVASKTFLCWCGGGGVVEGCGGGCGVPSGLLHHLERALNTHYDPLETAFQDVDAYMVVRAVNDPQCCSGDLRVPWNC